MHKKCKEILDKLNREQKIKISNYKFPEKQELKLKLKDLLEEKVGEKYYLSQHQIEIATNSKYLQRNRKIQRKDISDTLCARDYKEPKCVQVGSLMGEKWDKMHDVSKRVYSVEGISPTIHTCNGGNTEPKVMDKIKKIELPQKVKVRKYPVNTEKLKEVLRLHKSYTNKEIALKLNQPLTLVEHWFRKDDSFSIPNANIWFELKALLKIDTNEFDESITQFEEKEGAYEKSNRIYLDSGISPTLTSCSSDQPKIQESFVSKHYNNFIKKNGYFPKIFNPYHETEIKDIAPTQTTHCGSYGSSASVCIGENECKINEFPIPMHNYDYRIRKLTPKECWRLMGFDDEDFEKAAIKNSNTQLYKQAGNSIVVNVLQNIIRNLMQHEV